MVELPQFLFSKYHSKGIIGITQPRRVAAINLARRVAEEQGTILRNKVFFPSDFVL
jgi:HrpA-like RNA helicase